MRRVVVTGMAGLTSIGQDWDTVADNMRNGVTGIRYMEQWDEYADMDTRLGGPILESIDSPNFTRKKTRTMGRVSKMAVRATELALGDAGLLGNECVTDGRMGVAFGSSTGSTDAVSEFGQMLSNKSLATLNGTSYIRMMGHTAAVNIGLYFSMKGRIIPTSTACTSGSMGIGYAVEAIRSGAQDYMVAGGGEELCPSEAATFDVLFATSTINDRPDLAPRPYDKKRDGLVIGEGAGILVLEALEEAEARGANILAEVVGFGTNSDGIHATRPNRETMRIAMQKAVDQAQVDLADIGYVSGHGTATDAGDVEETLATAELFERPVPISAMKSYLGHSLGACGALESWASINMLNSGWFHSTAKLDEVDERCGDLDYIVGTGREIQTDYVMCNNFAFGGINTSLIFKRWKGN